MVWHHSFSPHDPTQRRTHTTHTTMHRTTPRQFQASAKQAVELVDDDDEEPLGPFKILVVGEYFTGLCSLAKLATHVHTHTQTQMSRSLDPMHFRPLFVPCLCFSFPFLFLFCSRHVLCTGKSAIVTRAVQNRFDPTYRTTLGGELLCAEAARRKERRSHGLTTC